MRRYSLNILIVFVLMSCGEKLLEAPEDLIPRDKMVLILKDMAIVNAAKGANKGILKDNAVEPTSYIFEKYEIDSAQFVESDRYYASLPVEYEAIYTEIETILKEEKEQLEAEKKIADSLKMNSIQQSKKSAVDSIKPTISNQ